MQFSFIIVVLDQLERVQAGLASLKSSLPPGLLHEIIVVDDGSGEATREYLRGLPPPHLVLHNDRTAGFEASANRAARVARGSHLLLLRPDLAFEPGWLAPLLRAFALHPRAGLVSSVLLESNSADMAEIGSIPGEGGLPMPLRENLPAVQARGELAELPLVGTGCCAVRREWFLHAGGFDEGYRDGGAPDLCLRAREDGFVNLVATASVVRCQSTAVASSTAAATHEYRNAQRFLDRWAPRAAAIGREFLSADAARIDAMDARRYFEPWWRRLGLGPGAVRRRYRAALVREQRARHAATRPVRIGVDLLRMGPGGANGGVKPFVYALLSEIGRARNSRFNFAVFAQRGMRDELKAVLRPGDFVIEPTADHFTAFRCEGSKGWRNVRRFGSADDVPKRAGLDALYAVFGVSQFMRPDLPCISLVVDLLHRDVPEALPIEEINYRHTCFERIAGEATFIQCNSHHVIARLGAHYGVHPAKCFHVYNVIQNRLPAPTRAITDPYFFYPANFWPHKNHETLLVAYRLYAQSAGSRAWPLILSGHPDERMKLLEEMRDGLGLAGRVQFVGHLDDTAFAALWAAATALVHPSLHEGFGIPLLEAMRFGVPIIAASAGSLPEVVGDAALLVDPRDPRALAEAMRRIAIREGLREDLIARGRARLGAFSLELEAGRLAHFLEAVARRQTP